MLTQEENERLTQVGPGTPMGNLLRRYWQPIATRADLEREEVLPVRRLGENLVLYKSTRGEMADPRALPAPLGLARLRYPA